MKNQSDEIDISQLKEDGFTLQLHVYNFKSPILRRRKLEISHWKESPGIWEEYAFKPLKGPPNLAKLMTDSMRHFSNEFSIVKFSPENINKALFTNFRILQMHKSIELY